MIHGRMQPTAGETDPRRLLRDRALIFAAALLTRGVAGWIFFGSVDLTNSMLNTARLMAGRDPSAVTVPYFHGVHHLLIWTAGVLATYTSLPLGFCYKIVPIVCEAVLAVAIFDAILPNHRRARIAGFLYAAAPVGVWITSIHAQWDSISFAFMIVALVLAAKRTPAASVLSGATFVISVLAKPMGIPFLPLLFPAPWRLFTKENRRHTFALLAGLAGATLVYLLWMYAIGDPLTPKLVAGIVGYADHGVVLFGLPHLFGGRASRLLSLIPLLVLVPLYWKGYLSRYEAVLLGLAAIIATAGLGPQYLMWLVPFLLICARDRYSALYTLLAGLFLVLYYHNPGVHQNNFENLGAYAPLCALRWLTPAADAIEAKALLLVLVGNFLLPFSALVFFLIELLRASRRAPSEEIPPPLGAGQLVAPAALAVLVVAASGIIAMSLPEVTPRQFSEMVHRRTAEYDMYRYRGPGLVHPHEPAWIIPAFRHEVQAAPVNIVTIGYVWVLAWAGASWLLAPRARLAAERAPVDPLLATAIVGAAVIVSAATGAMLAQLVRTPVAEEIRALHSGYLVAEGSRIYRDFFANDAPFLPRLLALVRIDTRSTTYPILELGTYVATARALMALFALIAAGAASWLAYRVTRWPGAPAIVTALVFSTASTIGDVGDQVPAAMLFWLGIALIVGRWQNGKRDALLAGAGLGLAVWASLWDPQWIFAAAALLFVYRVRAFGVRALYALLAALVVTAAAIGVLLSTASLTDYVNFRFDYNRRIAEGGGTLVWHVALAVAAAIAIGLGIQRLPERHRRNASMATIAIAAILFVIAHASRLKPTAEPSRYFTVASHMQKNLRPADTVWLAELQHPIAAPDAHYYWFGFDSHLLWVLDAQKRGELPPYLPRVDEIDLPPCAAARGRDPHVRFIAAGPELTPLTLTRRCVGALLRQQRAFIPAAPYGGFARLER